MSSALAIAADLLEPEGHAPKLENYWYDPMRFIRDFVVGFRPKFYQKECIEQLLVKKKVCVRAGHTAGKTSMVANIVLWFAITREDMCHSKGGDWKVVTTASVERQLTKYLWPEIRKWSRRNSFDWEQLGREPFDRRTELLNTQLKLEFGEAFAANSDEPANIEGAHADHILYIIDEAKTVRSETFDAIEGALMGEGEKYAFCISTPGEPSGRFYEIQARKPGYEDWWCKFISVEDAIKAGRITPEEVEMRKRQWGEDSAIFKNRVKGEFAVDALDGLIPLAWAEAAMLRGASIKEARVDEETRHLIEPGTQRPLSRPVEYAGLANCVSCDVARGGDNVVITGRIGLTCLPLTVFHSDDTMVVTGKVVEHLMKYGQRECTFAVVDVIGVGAGVVDRLRELGYDVEAFNGSSAVPFTDSSGELEFANRRASAYWWMRELLNPANPVSEEVRLPHDDELLGELVTPRYKTNSRGNILVESKDDIRKRLGRSPDRADAVVMAYADRLFDAPAPSVVEYYDPVTISPV